MTLALGTALQNGTYVIDALHGEDSIGPLYLATHVPSGQWVLVRVLGSRHPEALPDSAQRDAFYQSLDTLNQIDQAFIPKNLRGFEEDRVCYQTFSLPQGSPLSQSITPQSPRPLAPSLTIIQTLAQALQTLRPLGWAGLRITPDQVWQGPGGSLTLTGFDFPSSRLEAAGDEAEIVRGLTELLYFLLTGQRAAQAPLAVDLRYRRPELPTSLDALFQWERTSPAHPPKLDQWLALLPQPASLPVADGVAHRVSESTRPSPRPFSNTTAPNHPVQAESTMAVATRVAVATVDRPLQSSNPVIPGPSQPQARQRGPRITWALLATGLVFGVGGIAFGLQARLHPASPAAQTRFNPNQAFPPLPNWNSTSPGFDNPTVEGRRSRLGDRLNPSPESPASPQLRPSQTLDRVAPTAPTPDPVVRPQDPLLAPDPVSPAMGEERDEFRNNDIPDVPAKPAPTVDSDLPVVPREADQDSTPAPIQSSPDPAPAPPSAPAPVAPPAPDAVAPPPPLAPAPAPPAPLTSS
ncbi:MAG: hypothetical protein ACHWZW_05975 [Spirulina sp.]